MSVPTLEAQTPPVIEGEQTERLYGGKYKTVEELEAAYTAASAPVEPIGNAGLTAKKEDGSEEGTPPDDATVANALKGAGLDQAVFTQEFAETGALSEESLAALEKAGFPRSMTSIYLAGLKAEQATYEASIYAPAGGKDGYTKLLQWAGKNLDDASITAFNQAVTSGDAARAKMAVSGLQAQAKGSSPQLLNGKAAPVAGVQPYASRAEVQEAIRNPKYRNDPAYRDAHMARLRVTDLY